MNHTSQPPFPVRAPCLDTDPHGEGGRRPAVREGRREGRKQHRTTQRTLHCQAAVSGAGAVCRAARLADIASKRQPAISGRPKSDMFPGLTMQHNLALTRFWTCIMATFCGPSLVSARGGATAHSCLCRTPPNQVGHSGNIRPNEFVPASTCCLSSINITDTY